MISPQRGIKPPHDRHFPPPVDHPAGLVPRQRAARVLIKSRSEIRRVVQQNKAESSEENASLFHAVIPAEICQCEMLRWGSSHPQHLLDAIPPNPRRPHNDKKARRRRRWSGRLPRCHCARKHGLGSRHLRGSSWYPPLPFRHFRRIHKQSSVDMRSPSSQAAAQQRSINLAVSSRGIAAMQAIDPVAASGFLDNVIPMRGRMIHDSSGNLDSQPYDRNGQVGRVFPLIHRPRVHSRPCAAFVPRPEFPCS